MSKPVKPVAGVPPDKKNIDVMQDQLRSTIKVAMFSSAVGVCALMVAGVIFFIKPAPQNYAIYPDGRLIALTPTSSELSPAQISDMVSTAILTGLRFDFKNYTSQIGKIENFMSPSGYMVFTESIQGIVNQAAAGRYIVSTDIIQPTVIGKTVISNGVRMYKTSTIILIALEGQTSRIPPQKWSIESTVRRVPETENARGFVIDGFTMKPYNG